MADKLLPCPLCGGEATLVEDIYNDQLYYYVICSNDDCNANTGRCNTEDEAITKWNNRPSPWHTGTPTETGRYLVSNGYDTSISYFDGKSFIKNFLAFPDVGEIVKWQKIEEGEEVNG